MAPPKRKLKRGNVSEIVCLFCKSGADNSQKFGQKLQKGDITVHYFCMLFASGLCQNGKSDKEGILGFLIKDIHSEVKRGLRLKCTYCKRPGATVGCVKSACRRAFHFGCGRENGALSQFFGNFSSFCEDHCPKQVVPPRDRLSFQGTAHSTCAICMCAVEARASSGTLRTPCCKNAWFHRSCIQRQAIYSGIHFFKCALCNNGEMFQNEMLIFGIYIPDQDAAWELEPNAYHDLLERHSKCDVAKCLCREGRRYNKDNSNWEIILCDWCGSKGTHITCSSVKSASKDWICDECSNVATKNGATKKQKTTSRSKKPQIDDWFKSKFTNLNRHDDEEATNRKRPLTTDAQGDDGKKGCHVDSSRNFSASACGSGNNDTTSSASAASPPKHDTMLPRRSSNAGTRPRPRQKPYFGQRKRRRRTNACRNDKDVPPPPADVPRGQIVGCVIPASMTIPTSTGRNAKLSGDVSRTIDLDGRPMWYKRHMNDDYLTGRRLGARLLDGRDDLWTLENADSSRWGNRRSTAHSSVDSESTTSVAASTIPSSASSAVVLSSDESSEHDTPAMSCPRTKDDRFTIVGTASIVNDYESLSVNKSPTFSPAATDVPSCRDAKPTGILPICDDYRCILGDSSSPVFASSKANLHGTCRWDDRNCNSLYLSQCHQSLQIDLTGALDGNGVEKSVGYCSGVGCYAATGKVPEFIDLTELQELSEQEGWSETGTDSGIGDYVPGKREPPSLSRAGDDDEPASAIPDEPPVLSPSGAVSKMPCSTYPPLVNVGYFTIDQYVTENKLPHR